MVDSAEQARVLARAVRYPPAGVRRVATARAARWGRDADYWQVADESTCLIAQIETPAAVSDVEAIASVDGVDAVFVGPSDLAASLGYLGDAGHPNVRDRVLEAIGAAAHGGKPVGVFCPQLDLAQEYIEAGAQFVGVGVDTTALAAATSELLHTFREGLAVGP